MYTWGWSEHGQLGHGDVKDQRYPMCIAGITGDMIACGPGFTVVSGGLCS